MSYKYEDFDWNAVWPGSPSDPEYVALWEERYKRELSPDLNQAREWVFRCCGSSQKMDALFYLEGEMDFPDWLVLLGDLWTSCDNIGLYKDDIFGILEDSLMDPLTMIPGLMDDEEKAAFAALPDEITIYRGCGPRNKCGMSWSLNCDIAIRFPFYGRYRSDCPTLLTAVIKKTRAAAIKLSRNEQEIIVFELEESCWTEELITEAPSFRKLP